MPLDPDAVIGRAFDPVVTQLTPRDCMLYALSIGVGEDPVDPHALPFAFEKDLEVFPTQASVIGHPGNWINALGAGITRHMVVHGAIRLQIHRPLAPDASITALNSVVDLADKGDRGAVIVMERRLVDDRTGDHLASLESSAFCRADGGFGGKAELTHEFQPGPDRPADLTLEANTRPDAALIYRLNGDYNPLHADPEYARKAGFERPIMHGLCTYGVTAWTLLRGLEPGANLTDIQARFSKPAIPGERLAIDVWRLADGEVAFQTRAPGRGAVVLDRGRATFA